jgi:hypothetical protein
MFDEVGMDALIQKRDVSHLFRIYFAWNR